MGNPKPPQLKLPSDLEHQVSSGTETLLPSNQEPQLYRHTKPWLPSITVIPEPVLESADFAVFPPVPESVPD